ncbi:MAG TPA: glycosyltransferase [Solirubrobacterales bacterium]|nr:glycosyltransferase [Solirubrobacterales bacterium]
MANAGMTATDDRRPGEELLAPQPAEAVDALGAPPTFAIVITAYQAAETIAAAVRSALKQEHPAQQVIVVDDGSTDDLTGALEPFRGEIELIQQENRGGSAARNRGLEAVETEFMAVLDADDAYHPRRLLVIAEAARRRPDLDIVTTDARLIVDGNPDGKLSDGSPFAIEQQRRAIFERSFPGGWPALRKERLQAIGGFDEKMRIAYDWDCWLRLILSGSSAGMVDAPYYDYVLRSDSLSANRVASLWERVRLLEKATRSPHLQPAERPTLEQAVHWRRSEAVREEIRALSQAGDRRGLLRLAGTPGTAITSRLGAGLGAVSPALSRRLLGDPSERV